MDLLELSRKALSKLWYRTFESVMSLIPDCGMTIAWLISLALAILLSGRLPVFLGIPFYPERVLLLLFN